MILPEDKSPLQDIWSQNKWKKKDRTDLVAAKMRIVGSSSHSLGLRQENEYYATGSEDVKIFLRQLSQDGISLSQNIWEPSCGEGHIAKMLTGHNMICSDLIHRGYGNQMDFLMEYETLDGTKLPSKFDGDIITNPPYKGDIDIRFVRRALELIEDGQYVMMLFKTIWQNSKGRFLLFQEYKPKYIYNYSYRIKIHKNGNEPSNNALDYAWFIWQKGCNQEPTTRFIPNPKWQGYENYINEENK